MSKTYRISKKFSAPLNFVYRWCTDFREDDYKMSGTTKFEQTARRRFLERSDKRMIWMMNRRVGNRMVEGIRAVWLYPPDSWHLETCGDHMETGDYKLYKLNASKTRLDMKFTIVYDDPVKVQSQEEWARGPRKNWAAFARYLEADYRKSRNA
jgi:hypothetical protein